MTLFEISPRTIARRPSLTRIPVGELNGVLNGGIVTGSTTLIYGREGSGKTTLALKMASAAADSVPVLYAVAEDEMDPTSILHLAGRTGLKQRILGATVASIEEALSASSEAKAKMMVVDSLPALTPAGRGQNLELMKLKRFAKESNTAVVALMMLDTANRPAGGYRLLYSAHTVIEFLAPNRRDSLKIVLSLSEPRDFSLVRDDHDDASNRHIAITKARYGPTGSFMMRMTSSGLVQVPSEVDVAIAESLGSENSPNDGKGVADVHEPPLDS